MSKPYFQVLTNSCYGGFNLNWHMKTLISVKTKSNLQNNKMLYGTKKILLNYSI